MPSIAVDPQRMYANHFDYHRIREIVKIPWEWETCTIQMSEALNRSDLTIAWQPSPIIGLQQRGMNYIINVPAMRAYLNDRFFTAENYLGSRFLITTQIIGREGIIAFGDRHIDLWTGTDIQRPQDYNPVALWDDASTVRKGVFFWEMAGGGGFHRDQAPLMTA